MTARICRWLGRAVLVTAATLLVVAIALAALGVTITTWPYRKIAGPSRRRVQVEALLALAQAIATTGNAFRRERGGVSASSD